jgi:hypothetical protein
VFSDAAFVKSLNIRNLWKKRHLQVNHGEEVAHDIVKVDWFFEVLSLECFAVFGGYCN